MNCIYRRIVPAVLLLGPVLTFTAPVQAQNSVTASARPAISVLDSTKEQDGLVGSVRRVKTETARIELKNGHSVEGPPQLVELTTYGIKGNRIENTSYPIGGSLVGKEEYKYDARGNITEMTLRDNSGAILSREAYSYEFDKFGNWTRMVTNLVVFENGQLKREPVEVTYRTVTYYFDDNVAKAFETPVIAESEKPAAAVPEPIAISVPEPAARAITKLEALEVGLLESSARSLGDAGEPPPMLERVAKVESAFSARKNKEVESVEPAPVQPQPKSEFKPETRPAAKPATVALQPASVSSVQKLANDLYLSGRGQFEAGDMRGAIESFLQSVKLEPGSAEVFRNLGHAYLKLEKDREAIKAFKESAKLNPETAETFYGLGVASFRTRKFRDAIDAFKKATTLNPKMAKAHYGLAMAYQELNDTNGLMAEYRILERLDLSLAKKLAATFPEYNFPCRRGGAGCQ
jgi:tetratricopeptide (TPR) repeat protein